MAVQDILQVSENVMPLGFKNTTQKRHISIVPPTI